MHDGSEEVIMSEHFDTHDKFLMPVIQGLQSSRWNFFQQLIKLAVKL